jgi:hypothetical protein
MVRVARFLAPFETHFKLFHPQLAQKDDVFSVHGPCSPGAGVIPLSIIHMKGRIMTQRLLLLLVASAVMGCSHCPAEKCTPSANPAADRDTLYQTSTITALLAGEYDGDLTCGQLKARGDIGLGTFNALDGEMKWRTKRSRPLPR